VGLDVVVQVLLKLVAQVLVVVPAVYHRQLPLQQELLIPVAEVAETEIPHLLGEIAMERPEGQA
jgi:hypothetical protein